MIVPGTCLSASFRDRQNRSSAALAVGIPTGAGITSMPISFMDGSVDGPMRAFSLSGSSLAYLPNIQPSIGCFLSMATGTSGGVIEAMMVSSDVSALLGPA